MSLEQVPLRVAPTRALRAGEAQAALHQAMVTGEPLVMLGAERVPSLVSDGVRPSRQTCFGPRGAALLGPSGPLWISDTGHHRLLGFRARPDRDEAPADWVIGQPDFQAEGRNGKGPLTARSVNVPTGICGVGAQGLVVADAWNHRVLIWKTTPEDSNVPADLVLGQHDFTAGEPNRGRDSAASDSMYWPYGVACFDGRIFVADSGNRRVLVWNEWPVENGQPADLVLGQRRFDARDENAGGLPDASSMRWPHAVCSWRGRLCVTDAGNNRIMVWKGMPEASGGPADFILGQAGNDGVDHNQSLYWPRASTLNMPYGVAAAGDWLFAADTANSRLLGWHIDDLTTGAGARALAGQATFHDKGDNRWTATEADSLCWPYGLAAHDGILVVADTGNNRVSLWEIAL